MATWVLTGSPENPNVPPASSASPPGAAGSAVGTTVEQHPVSPSCRLTRKKRRRSRAPVTILDRDRYVPAESVVDDLEHARKWPPAHWQLAFQGQLRTISDADAHLLGERIADATPTLVAAR